ncbi:TPA: hypothetical protein N0F65_003167 [Lagenidium giganteum]|uniref:Uncharacterized protein n=1 Tax=Lagenidium giganteum TaxID=4803 RepID=A0AAV2ZAD7_9STRA|nr:TPA: hypothetical protein N0F65_003167 [Lagenidium giganteum]
MIMKRLKYVKVMTDERLRLGIELAPLLCRVRFQVLSHAKLILGLVIAIAVAGIGYRKYKLRRTEKEFIDRMVKEVRYFLLERAGSKDSYYPAIHLRDHLFDALNVDQRDRKWLRRAVWPKVAALVVEDSRIRTRNAQ